MKEFIVLLATLPIMLICLMQLSLTQVNNTKISLASDIVYAAKEEAKQEGGFDEDSLRTTLSEKLGISEEDFVIEVSKIGTVPRILSNGERGIIYYKVIIPIDKVYVGKSFFGIKDNTRYGYKIESSAASEYLP